MSTPVQQFPIAPRLEHWQPIQSDDPFRESSIFYLNMVLDAVHESAITIDFPTIARETLEACLADQAQHVRDCVVKHWADITLKEIR